MLNEYNLVIGCKDCGIDFDFAPKDQRFFEEMGWEKPVRCKECREKKKAFREAIEQERSETEEAVTN